MGEGSALHHIVAAFRGEHGQEPRAVVRAPGRVNLIGEHTDYNGGFVLPMAIDREVRIALAPREDDRVSVRSLDLEDTVEFRLSALTRGTGWGEYLKGVAWALGERGLTLSGFDGVMSGNVPRGSGLSSSAAVELAAARAFAFAGGFEWEPIAIAVACQRAENEWLGVASGIMDQLTSAAATAGSALLIDCRKLTFEAVPLPPGSVVLVLDTGTRRGLVGSAYNERREQCEQAARLLGVASLRDVGPDELEVRVNELPEPLRRRARHVVTEIDRTVRASEAMRAGDAHRLGELMHESHASLRDDFEVSSGALDAMVECAGKQPGCYGARLTGAGFAGCAVALASEEEAQAVAAATTECYLASTGRRSEIYECRPVGGASLVPRGG